MSSGAESLEVKSYRDLRVWQLAMDLTEQVYLLAKPLPTAEMYGLTSQARRAAVSIAANIAEGYGRDTSPSFVNHLRLAQGSLKEVETHLLLAARLGFVDERTIAPQMLVCDELGRMMRALIRSIQRKAEQ